MNRPRLAVGSRLHFDEVRGRHVLLVPEGAVSLNRTAVEVLELCDGRRGLPEIVAELSTRYAGHDVDEDVAALLDALVRHGVVIDAAA